MHTHTYTHAHTHSHTRRENQQLTKSLAALAPLLHPLIPPHQAESVPPAPAAAAAAGAGASQHGAPPGMDLQHHAALHQLPEWLFVGPTSQAAAAAEVCGS